MRSGGIVVVWSDVTRLTLDKRKGDRLDLLRNSFRRETCHPTTRTT